MCCCGEDVRNNAENIAIYQIVMSGILLFFGIVGLANFAGSSSEYSSYRSKEQELLIFMIWALVIGCVIQIIFSSSLYAGVQKGKASYCRAWLVYMYIGLTIQLLEIVIALLTGNVSAGAPSVFGIALAIYFIKVVHEYIGSLSGVVDPRRGRVMRQPNLHDNVV